MAHFLRPSHCAPLRPSRKRHRGHPRRAQLPSQRIGSRASSGWGPTSGFDAGSNKPCSVTEQPSLVQVCS